MSEGVLSAEQRPGPTRMSARPTGAELLALSEAELFRRADEGCRSVFGDRVYLRGLIETTNSCVRDCAYCGIRRSNAKIGRYRFSDETIHAAVLAGYRAGLRSFVLQGAEDPDFGPERLARLAEG
ncbi:MAG TPA: [FeFe] hydrogenase H-cluster radical SAM maturase HydE, partial [Rectinemataceae bacterium]|nr:[FeFe] hydrogenase H-cluster radical SAM maturase HydE [Rectinemataceae bacterium]